METVDTLQALNRMLSKLPNMAVGNHIKRRVESAVTHLLQSAEYTDPEHHRGALAAAYRQSRMAVEQAELAFFDPTMTALLYFPAEHLLAVYAPLLFPVIIALLMAMRRLYRETVM